MTPRRLDLIGTLARLGLAAVFLVSGYIKASDLDQTYVAVNAYQVLPKPAVEVVAVVLPWFELAVGVLLLVGVGTRIIAVISALMLLMFMAGVAQAWARGLSIDCGCFGGGGDVAADKTSYGTELLRDTGFMILAVWLIVRPTTLWSLDGWLGRSDAGADLSGEGVRT
ncbi:MAG TPA: MauE/DoxX family redox-associated membrane protein [Pseudonocardia sp.]|nr:MauE/DoxX family redox-associated membrane protein [Pseudonocardia sp.]